MPKRTQARGRLVAAIALSLCSVVLPGTARAAAPFDVGSGLWVYTNNVENLTGGNGGCVRNPAVLDTLMNNIASQSWAPDVFLAQQVNGRQDAAEIARRLGGLIGNQDAYSYVVSDPDPSPMKQTDCTGKVATDPKKPQTNAVIWRNTRFSPNAPLARPASSAGLDPINPTVRPASEGFPKTTFQSFVDQLDDNTSACVSSTQSRTLNVGLELLDRLTGRRITVASIHWPTGAPAESDDSPKTFDGAPCAYNNAYAATSMTVYGTSGHDLEIWGGDANIQGYKDGAWQQWYRAVNGDQPFTPYYNFRDPVFFTCTATSPITITSPPNACLNNQNTKGTRRIDHLFARKPTTTRPNSYGSGETVPYASSTNKYSEHRAVRSYFEY